MSEESQEYYADLHCHPTMRLFHNQGKHEDKSYWKENYNQVIDTSLARWVSKMSDDVAKVSQTTFEHCLKGRVRILFDSLYPIERGFVRFRKIPEAILGEKTFETVVVTSSGVSSEQFHRFRNSDDYFGELEEQYELLTSKQGPSEDGTGAFKVVNSYSEMKTFLDADPNHVAIIVTIEGAHAFGCGTPTTEKMPEDELTQQVLANIQKVKNWEHPPFFITFAHHFWNQLCGHAATLPTVSRFTCNQNPHLNEGITPLGWKVLEALLSRENGKRILIDTRHMSAKARMEYYDYIAQHNKAHPEDRIPVISSHAATNGFDTMEASWQVKDNMAKKKSTPFCSWSLNISAEEMNCIHDSGGMVGIILDKGRHSGVKVLESIESIQDPIRKKEAFVKLILDNIFALVSAVGKKSAWDVLMLGTDFDGVITHFEQWENLSKMPELKKDFIHYLREYKYKEALWFGYTPEEIFHKIFMTNSLEFLERNFK